MAQRDSTIIYRSFYEATKNLSTKNKADIWDAICEFSFNHQDIELQGISKAIFILIKPQLEANYKRFISGSQAKTKQEPSEPKANNNKNNYNNKDDNININWDGIKSKFLSDQLWAEQFCMTKKIYIDDFYSHLNTFLGDIDLKNDIKSLKELKSHFVNWYNKNKPKPNGKIERVGTLDKRAAERNLEIARRRDEQERIERDKSAE